MAPPLLPRAANPSNNVVESFAMFRSNFAAPMVLFATLALGTQPQAAAQGVIVDERTDVLFRLPRPWPRPQTEALSYRIDALEVNAALTGSVAKVQVSQTFVNTGSRQLEARFLFPLPYDGAIDAVTLMVDGKEYAASLLTKEEARSRYEAIVRQNKDPALLEWVGVGMFQTSVFPIPPGASRTVTIRYAQICRTSHGLTDFVFPLSTAKYTAGPIRKLKVRVAVASDHPIKNLYSTAAGVNITRPDDRHAAIVYERKDFLPDADFRLFYDSGQTDVGVSVVSYRGDSEDEGYFLLLASPSISAADAKPEPKTVLFVVDRSGSMSGEKMEQAREAAEFVLNNLREGDLFNIVAYDTDVETFRPELERYSPQTRQAALGFIHGLYAGGGTNIHGALKRAFAMLQDSERPSYVLFLTDGLATSGVTDESTIVSDVQGENRVRARVFPFGVGFDVNSRLLDKLARSNFGYSEYVRPDENIETAVSSLYRRIGAPVLTDVELGFAMEDAEVDEAAGPQFSRIYPRGSFDLFAGDQAVIVGRYRDGGSGRVTLTGRIGGVEQAFHFPLAVVEASPDDANAFVARLWATRRVGEIVDQIDLNGKNDELIAELVALAKKHGVLTPYTSFLADENSDIRNLTQAAQRAADEAEALAVVDGRLGFQQRAAKGRLQRVLSFGGVAEAAPGDDRFAAIELEKLSESGGRGVRYYDAVEGRDKIANTVFQVGRKTFFRRGNHWVDSTVSVADEKQIKKIERYSRAYFDLIDQHGVHVAPYLAMEDGVTIKLGGETYQW